jgi:hypothetical protein
MRVDKEMGKIEWERVKKRKNSRVRSLTSHNSDVALGGGVTAFLFAQIESDQHPPRSPGHTNAPSRKLCATPHRPGT